MNFPDNPRLLTSKKVEIVSFKLSKLLSGFLTLLLVGSATTAHDQNERLNSQSPVSLTNQCCSLVRNHKTQNLKECVNNVLIDWNNAYTKNNIPRALQREGPTLVVTIVSRSTPNINEYASYAHFAQAYFALHNNYRMLPILQSDSPSSDYIYHRKLAPLIEALKGSAVDTDYLVWMDAG